MSEISFVTVTALTKYIKRKFDVDPHLEDIWIKGELSNVKIHSRGHSSYTEMPPLTNTFIPFSGVKARFLFCLANMTD